MSYNYNLNDSIPEDEVAYFILSPINIDLCSVPGISNVNKDLFIKYGILNTYQFISMLMAFNDRTCLNTDTKIISKEIYSRSYIKLRDDIKINESDIDLILKSAFSKIDCMMPGFIDIDM